MKWQMTSSCLVSDSQVTWEKPWQIKHNSREGKVLDEDTAGKEDLKQVTLRSSSKIRLLPSVVEEGAAGVEHCGKCSLHPGVQGQPWGGLADGSSLQYWSLHKGWWTDFKTDFSGLSNKKPFFFPLLRQDLGVAESNGNLARLKTRNWTRRSFLWIQVWRLPGCLQKPCQPPACSGCLCPRPTHQSQQASIERIFSQVWTMPGTFPSLNTKYLLQVVLRVEELKHWDQKQNTLFHKVWISTLLIATLIPDQGVLALKYQIQPLLCQYMFCLGTQQNACSFPSLF